MTQSRLQDGMLPTYFEDTLRVEYQRILARGATDERPGASDIYHCLTEILIASPLVDFEKVMEGILNAPDGSVISYRVQDSEKKLTLPNPWDATTGKDVLQKLSVKHKAYHAELKELNGIVARAEEVLESTGCDLEKIQSLRLELNDLQNVCLSLNQNYRSLSLGQIENWLQRETLCVFRRMLSGLNPHTLLEQLEKIMEIEPSTLTTEKKLEQLLDKMAVDKDAMVECMLDDYIYRLTLTMTPPAVVLDEAFINNSHNEGYLSNILEEMKKKQHIPAMISQFEDPISLQELTTRDYLSILRRHVGRLGPGIHISPTETTDSLVTTPRFADFYASHRSTLPAPAAVNFQLTPPVLELSLWERFKNIAYSMISGIGIGAAVGFAIGFTLGAVFGGGVGGVVLGPLFAQAFGWLGGVFAGTLTAYKVSEALTERSERQLETMNAQRARLKVDISDVGRPKDAIARVSRDGGAPLLLIDEKTTIHGRFYKKPGENDKSAPSPASTPKPR